MITILPASLLRVTTIVILFSLILALAYPVLAEDATTGGTTRRDKIQDKVETKKETVRTNVQDKMANLKERMATKAAALKDKLDTFKNKTKAQIAERISTNLNKINQTITEAMKKHLEKMSSILDKLEERVNSSSPDIKNKDLANQAIASASAAIATATAAVDAQAANDYTLVVGSESTVRTDAQTMRQKLHDDLQNVRRLVIAAKQAVGNAIRVAKSGKLEVPGREATSSGE